MQTVDDIFTEYKKTFEAHREAEIELMKYLVKNRLDYSRETERLLAEIGAPERVDTLEYPLRRDHPNSLDRNGTLRPARDDRQLPSRLGPRSRSAPGDHRSARLRRQRHLKGWHRPRPGGRKPNRPAQARPLPAVAVGASPARDHQGQDHQGRDHQGQGRDHQGQGHRGRGWKAVRKVLAYGCAGIFARWLITDGIKAIANECSKLF